MFSLLGKKNKTGFNNILWEAGVSFCASLDSGAGGDAGWARRGWGRTRG